MGIAFPPTPQEAARERANSNVADTVAEALERDRIAHGRATADYREISRRVGRSMGRTLHRIISEQGATVSTLADIALALDHHLVIKLVPKGHVGIVKLQ